jgi:hypothetical protein
MDVNVEVLVAHHAYDQIENKGVDRALGPRSFPLKPKLKFKSYYRFIPLSHEESPMPSTRSRKAAIGRHHIPVRVPATFFHRPDD